ncbi:hypothetical protein IWW50_003362, partial [Coemansia erecta]
AREHGGGHRLETPYVVNMHAAHVLADAQPVWTFCHDQPGGSPIQKLEAVPGGSARQRLEPTPGASAPEALARRRWAANAHNQRASSTSFSARTASVVHGLAGFFDAELYPGVELSICPASHTPDMHSWFPMYFPIQHPLTVAPGARIDVHMWRRSLASKTWYEWCVDAGGDSSGIHNAGGHEFWIGQ